uniref:Frizzled domain-containing protein n=1 Tax=Trichobilharzia regenti TaxID=157069 RepID=A0AA85J0V9_TRIRE|nr:unnamed protein product [Trichobilharzia regenti]
MNACDLYEYLYRDKWLIAPGHTNVNSNTNRRVITDSSHPSHKPYGLKYPTENVNFAAYLWNIDEVYGPNPELFMLRIFMSLVTGFTCSLWMWTVKVHKILNGYSLQRPSVEGQLDLRCGIVGCSNTTTTGCPTDINLNCHQKSSYPTTSLLTKGHLSQLDTSFIPRDLEHSTATTPGYYSHAKISPNRIIDSMSEDASASSIPPPLPPATSRPPRLPARGDPCIGASASQVFTFTNKLNTEKLDNSKTCQNHNDTNSSETENYSLIKFQVT